MPVLKGYKLEILRLHLSRPSKYRLLQPFSQIKEAGLNVVLVVVESVESMSWQFQEGQNFVQCQNVIHRK